MRTPTQARLCTGIPLRPAACALALALGFAGGTHAATGVVIDPAAIKQRAVNFGETLGEYAKEAKRWSETLTQYTKELAHYQQMLSSVTNLNFNSLLQTTTLTKITDTGTFVQQACPGSDGIVGTITSTLGLSSLNLNGNISQSQQQICQTITLLQIDNYNKTVDLINSMPKYEQQFSQIESLRNALGGTNANGNLQANTNEAARTANKLEKDMTTWRSQVAANDAAIKTLQQQQSILATIALKGKPSTLGTIIKAGAVATAFAD